MLFNKNKATKNMTMNEEMKAVELTDKELEKVTGGRELNPGAELRGSINPEIDFCNGFFDPINPSGPHTCGNCKNLSDGLRYGIHTCVLSRC